MLVLPSALRSSNTHEDEHTPPIPDPAPYGAGWITKVGWLGSSRTYGRTRFEESGR
jgi:hypothetical protein